MSLKELSELLGLSQTTLSRAIEDAGLEMARVISVVTFDDDLGFLTAAGEMPAFTACKSSVKAAGACVAKMLLRQIKDPTAPLETKLLDAELIIDRSTGPFRG